MIIVRESVEMQSVLQRSWHTVCFGLTRVSASAVALTRRKKEARQGWIERPPKSNLQNLQEEEFLQCRQILRAAKLLHFPPGSPWAALSAAPRAPRNLSRSAWSRRFPDRPQSRARGSPAALPSRLTRSTRTAACWADACLSSSAATTSRIPP